MPRAQSNGLARAVGVVDLSARFFFGFVTRLLHPKFYAGDASFRLRFFTKWAKIFSHVDRVGYVEEDAAGRH